MRVAERKLGESGERLGEEACEEGRVGLESPSIMG